MTFALIIIIAIIIITIVIYKNSKGSNGDKKVVDEFFESIKPLLLSIILEEVKGTDLSKYINSENGVAEFEADFLDSIYVKAIKTTVDQMSLMMSDVKEYNILKNNINDKKIKEYTYSLFSGDSMQDKIANLYNEILEAKCKKIEEDDKKLEAEQDLFDNGLDGSTDDDIAKEESTNIDPERGIEKPETIIPPTDNPNYLYDPDIDDEVSRAEYDQYQLIANKGIIDTSKRKQRPKDKEE